MEIRPLVLLGEDGSILDVTMMNRKSYTKSLENNELWYFHPDTGRVLPHPEGTSFMSLQYFGNWYQATLPSKQTVKTAVLIDEKSTTDGDEETPPSESVGWETVLRNLVDIIADRKKQLPEGSYTSYLFEAGEEKIRKKTGEEAIELLLASTPEEVSSEAADLLYHLLVLLAELGIPFGEVLAELEKRS